MRRLEGFKAIEYAEAHSLTLNKYCDPTEDAREGLTPEEARAVARETAKLIYLDIRTSLDEIKRYVQEYVDPKGVLVATDDPEETVAELTRVMGGCAVTVDEMRQYLESLHIAQVDFDESYYLGSSGDGVYFDAAQDKDGKWYVSGVVDSDTSHNTDSLFTDDGPYDTQAQALTAGLHGAYEWLVENHVRGWRKDYTSYVRKFKTMERKEAK